MSAEEDAELKNLVAQTLENKGILPKIRAELRANVFLALEENPNTKETLLRNDELSAFVKIPIGTLILNLIREFLEFFELEFTLSVFDPETKFGKEYSRIAKEKIMKELKIPECDQRNPLLYKVLKRVIDNTDLRVSGSESNLEDLGQGDVSGSCDSAHMIPSLLALNSTYVKARPEVESLPPSPIEKEGSKEDDNETIKEELLSNHVSDTNSILGAEINLERSPRLEILEDNMVSKTSSKESHLNSPEPVPKINEDIDLLTFTPVKESRSRESMKSSSVPADKEAKPNEIKENKKQKSVLGDLPPLSGKADDKGDKINKIKAIMDKWPGLEAEEQYSSDSKSNSDQVNDDKFSNQIKSDWSEQSQKSDRTESTDDFDEDISDLLNGHTASDGQLTIDETVSKLSCEGDYLESV